MTPEQKIKAAILQRGIANEEIDATSQFEGGIVPEITAENVDEMFSDFYDELQDTISEFRCGSVETNIPADWSRHYESKSVATQLPDGAWIGWTYWYGGGKHGEPEAVDWMDDAYCLDVTEEQKMVTVRTFKKNEGLKP